MKDSTHPEEREIQEARADFWGHMRGFRWNPPYNESWGPGPDYMGQSLIGHDFEYARLSKADFKFADLENANLRHTSLIHARFEQARLLGADFSGSYLPYANFDMATACSSRFVGATLNYANLRNVDFSQSNLSGAKLVATDCEFADFSDADLSGADLTAATLNETNFCGSNLNGCRVYGTSVWNVTTDDDTKQLGLIITRPGEPEVQVDDLQVAHFVYLLLSNRNLRRIIDTVGRRTVLILGRFSPDRLLVLHAIRDCLRENGYAPILFDFEGPSNRDLTETVVTLALMSRFVIADLTDPRSVPQELSHIVPHYPSIPVLPLIAKGESEYGMFEHFLRYDWVQNICQYASADDLQSQLNSHLINLVESAARKQTGDPRN